MSALREARRMLARLIAYLAVLAIWDLAGFREPALLSWEWFFQVMLIGWAIDGAFREGRRLFRGPDPK